MSTSTSTSEKPSMMDKIKNKLHLGHHRNSSTVPNTNHPDAAYTSDMVREHRKDVLDGGDRTAYQDLPSQSLADRAQSKLDSSLHSSSSYGQESTTDRLKDKMADMSLGTSSHSHSLSGSGSSFSSSMLGSNSNSSLGSSTLSSHNSMGSSQQWSSSQLSGSQLSGAQLSGSQLSGAQLSGSQLSGAQLSNLSGETLVQEGAAVMSVQPVAAVMKKEIIQPVTTYKAETNYVTKERSEPVVRHEKVTKTVPKVEWVEKTHTEPVVTYVKKTHMEPVVTEKQVVTSVPKVEHVTRTEEVPVTSYKPETHFVRQEAGHFTAGLDKLQAGAKAGLDKLTGHSHAQSSLSSSGSSLSKAADLNAQPSTTTTTTTTTNAQ